MTTEPTTAGDRLSPHDLERVLNETFIDRVDHCAESPSTNSRALELAAAAPDDDQSILVIADRQTDGRGRGANTWWSADGALTFSVLIKTLQFAVPVSRWPQLSLTTGLAICEAIESVRPQLTTTIKWPNDVYLGGRKVAGILVEGADVNRGRLIVGIGLNVNNSMTGAPAELCDKATALCDAVGQRVSPIEMLVAILRKLAARLEWLSRGTAELQAVWSQRCLLTGCHVEIELPTRRIAGHCAGIDGEGALVVNTEDGAERCLSGVVACFSASSADSPSG